MSHGDTPPKNFSFPDTRFFWSFPGPRLERPLASLRFEFFDWKHKNISETHNFPASPGRRRRGQKVGVTFVQLLPAGSCATLRRLLRQHKNPLQLAPFGETPFGISSKRLDLRCDPTARQAGEASRWRPRGARRRGHGDGGGAAQLVAPRLELLRDGARTFDAADLQGERVTRWRGVAAQLQPAHGVPMSKHRVHYSLAAF